MGISWIAARNLEALLYGTENARDVSCDIEDNEFAVLGSGYTEELLGIGTSSGRGAVRGNVLDDECGKTNVNSARRWMS